jgi:hypothetical protein
MIYFQHSSNLTTTTRNDLLDFFNTANKLRSFEAHQRQARMLIRLVRIKTTLCSCALLTREHKSQGLPLPSNKEQAKIGRGLDSSRFRLALNLYHVRMHVSVQQPCIAPWSSFTTLHVCMYVSVCECMHAFLQQHNHHPQHFMYVCMHASIHRLCSTSIASPTSLHACMHACLCSYIG